MFEMFSQPIHGVPRIVHRKNVCCTHLLSKKKCSEHRLNQSLSMFESTQYNFSNARLV